ncbi:MAG: hypothetical protein HC866_19580 [Leptolyngbyaceae cyanobacterium RU_5_1]|nr:hypothetical protein [Leptolyngbyaceae cyanobacterium RU_5_1]
MHQLIRLFVFLSKALKVVGFLILKICEPPSQRRAVNHAPIINLKPKQTAAVQVHSTVQLEPVAPVLPSTAEEQSTAIAIHDLTPQIEIPKPEIYDLTPEIQLAKPAIEPVAIAEIDRATEVDAALNEAWSTGVTTYTGLMEYVKEKTGKSCSRRMISNWKKQNFKNVPAVS